jgi:succinoglycan biosynthesis protein ExoM
MLSSSPTQGAAVSQRTDTSCLTNHICICVASYKRPQLLKRLLLAISDLKTEGVFTYSVVVVDNDRERSSEAVVMQFAATSPFPIKYCVEPEQSIALARNRAVDNAEGDFIATIDDDEFPSPEWLLNLFKTCEQYHVDGVLGPVNRHFDETPPKWISRGTFFVRPDHPTGFELAWNQTRTGNTLCRREILQAGSKPFRPEFRSSSDSDFFRRMMAQGRKFIWCAEAVVYEVVPPTRWKRSYMLRRALLRGATAAKRGEGVSSFLRSLVAIPLYALALPFAQLLGHDKFMLLLIKLCDHIGKILTALGFNPIKDAYVSD